VKKIIMRFAPVLASLALFVGINSVNSPSFVILHQPKVPDGLEKYKK
jgi:cyclic lactone autoinducer peptide